MNAYQYFWLEIRRYNENNNKYRKDQEFFTQQDRVHVVIQDFVINGGF